MITRILRKTSAAEQKSVIVVSTRIKSVKDVTNYGVK